MFSSASDDRPPAGASLAIGIVTLLILEVVGIALLVAPGPRDEAEAIMAANSNSIVGVGSPTLSATSRRAAASIWSLLYDNLIADGGVTGGANLDYLGFRPVNSEIALRFQVDGRVIEFVIRFGRASTHCDQRQRRRPSATR